MNHTVISTRLILMMVGVIVLIYVVKVDIVMHWSMVHWGSVSSI
jgi:hypothetical protein